MGEHIIGRRAIGQDNLGHEGPDVFVIFLEAADVAAQALFGQPLGAALPAQINRGHAVALCHQIARGFEIALHEISAAAQE